MHARPVIGDVTETLCIQKSVFVLLVVKYLCGGTVWTHQIQFSQNHILVVHIAMKRNCTVIVLYIDSQMHNKFW